MATRRSIRDGLQKERRSFAATLLAVGPDAPTLCEGWDAAELAAHVVVRERRLDADLSLLIPWRPLRTWTDRVRGRARRSTPFPELAARVRRGSIFTRLPLVEPVFNLTELYVHHEDVRRGSGPAAFRQIPGDMEAALWHQLRRLAPWSFRRDRELRIDLGTPGGRGASVHPTGSGPRVVIGGESLELLLYVFGRRDAADVTIEGDAEAIARLTALTTRS